jgi:hypothetical protein
VIFRIFHSIPFFVFLVRKEEVEKIATGIDNKELLLFRSVNFYIFETKNLESNPIAVWLDTDVS